jgi:hypothetical protein
MWQFFHDHPLIGLVMVMVVASTLAGIITSFAH